MHVSPFDPPSRKPTKLELVETNEGLSQENKTPEAFPRSKST